MAGSRSTSRSRRGASSASCTRCASPACSCSGRRPTRWSTSPAARGPGSRAVGVPIAMEGTALFCGQPVDLDTLVTVGPADELDFYAPRRFDILGLVDRRRPARGARAPGRASRHRHAVRRQARVQAGPGAPGRIPPRAAGGAGVAGRQSHGAAVPPGAARARADRCCTPSSRCVADDAPSPTLAQPRPPAHRRGGRRLSCAPRIAETDHRRRPVHRARRQPAHAAVQLPGGARLESGPLPARACA